MSWFGNLEGVGELTEEDKVFIKTETTSGIIGVYSFPFIVASVFVGIYAINQNHTIKKLLHYSRWR
jgi:hypothetical protein